VTSAGGNGGSPPESPGGAGLRVPRAGTALLATLAMAQFMVVLDFTIVNVALPSIQHGLHIPTTTLQWLVSAYAVTFGGFLLLGGRLSDLSAGPGCTGSGSASSSLPASLEASRSSRGC
jgi:MFS family permease